MHTSPEPGTAQIAASSTDTCFEDDVELALANLSLTNHKTAVDLVTLPLAIRGFGFVKENNYKAAQQRRSAYRTQLSNGLCRS
ncbi:DUF6537 domain-containing protein [Paraburkholderia rhynchosiae]|uniref:DUF6537 domain-containing protein n=1 Tax=Paraburkholderia rhynchosiae TaxID=487049 RepID=UPI002ADDCEB9|nr:DUF6537 domain-containing protein [Paraburkholderia rhynchosiae]